MAKEKQSNGKDKTSPYLRLLRDMYQVEMQNQGKGNEKDMDKVTLEEIIHRLFPSVRLSQGR